MGIVNELRCYTKGHFGIVSLFLIKLYDPESGLLYSPNTAILVKEGGGKEQGVGGGIVEQ